MQVLVTGGAGFIGSHLAERLIEDGHDVTVVDNLSTGRREWIPRGADFVKLDLTDRKAVHRAVDSGFDCVFHLASNARVDDPNPRLQFEANTGMTYNLAEAMVDAEVPELVFTSTSAVYGEAPCPTPEGYGPVEPISMYGASKLSAEGLLSTFAHTHGIAVRTVRFANIVGARSRGAVIPDFIHKLQDDPDHLVILGDGRQAKSYLHISDCIEAVIHVWTHGGDPLETVNIGTTSTTSVDRIAAIVCEELDVTPSVEYTGGDRGWDGDIPRMRLAVEKLRAMGWEPALDSDEAVKRAVREQITELGEDRPRVRNR